MSVVLQELESFTHFAQQKLGTSESILSLEDCVRLWRQQIERDATIDDTQQGRADLDAGLAQPLVTAFDDVRQQLVLAKSCALSGCYPQINTRWSS